MDQSRNSGLSQVSAQVGGARGLDSLSDAVPRGLLDVDVGGFGDAGERPVGESRGEQQRDRAAVAVADQQRPGDGAGIQDLGQGPLRLPVQIVARPGQRERLRAPEAPALVDQARQAGSGAERLRKILPLGDAAEPLVQEHQMGPARRRPLGLQALHPEPPAVGHDVEAPAAELGHALGHRRTLLTGAQCPQALWAMMRAWIPIASP
jgi:hypothetical protein